MRLRDSRHKRRIVRHGGVLTGAPRVFVVVALAAIGAAAVLVGRSVGDAPSAVRSERATRPTASSLDPRLRASSAQLVLVRLHDTEEEFLRLRFSRPVVDAAAPRDVVAVGLDTRQRVAATVVRSDRNDARALVVGFAPGTDLNSFAVVDVKPDSVHDRHGLGNVGHAVPLRGAEGLSGRTTVPELASVRVDVTMNRVEYRFDQALDHGHRVDPDAFVVVAADGSESSGARLVTVHDRHVVVEFDARALVAVRHAVRFAVAEHAVRDRSGSRSLAGLLGAGTARPDLVSAEPASTPRQWLLRFDEPITSPVAARALRLWTVSGTRHRATHATLAAPNAILATFSTLPGSHTDARGASIEANSVRALDGDEYATSAFVPIAPAAPEKDPGMTLAPDVVAVERRAASGEIVVRYDEQLADARLEPRRFRLVTEAGRVVPATSARISDRRRFTVIARFPEPVAMSAVTAEFDASAVTDIEGMPSVRHANLLSTVVTGAPALPANVRSR